MSRNSKNQSRHIAARAMSALRVSGGNGPKKTTPKHSKRNRMLRNTTPHGSSLNEYEKRDVAAVCGTQVHSFGPVNPRTQRRRLYRVTNFKNYGAALLHATEFDAAQANWKQG